MNIFHFLFGKKQQKTFNDQQQRATSNSGTGGLSTPNDTTVSPFYTSIFPAGSSLQNGNENQGSLESNSAAPAINLDSNSSSDSTASGGSYDGSWDADSNGGDSGSDSGGGDSGGGGYN